MREKTNEVLYWNDNRLDKVKLEIYGGSISKKDILARFPKQKDKYHLKISKDVMSLDCLNPNGVHQSFYISMSCIPFKNKFKCISQSSIVEYLYFEHYVTLKEIQYSSSLKPQRTTLKILSSDNSNFKVQFLGDNKIYILTLNNDMDKVTCKNPDGTVQVFYLE
jgi:hypothetical protein